MVLMALAIIPYGSTAGRVRQGLLRGLALGAVGGVAIFAALVYQHPISRGAMAQALWVYVVATAALCAAVAAGFAHLAVRRRQWMDDQWK